MVSGSTPEQMAGSSPTDLLLRISREHPELAVSIQNLGVYNLRSHTAAGLGTQFTQLVSEFRSNMKGRRALVEAALTWILVQAARMRVETDHMDTASNVSIDGDALLVQRYRALVEHRYAHEVTIAALARELTVSQERLRQACVRLCDLPPHGLLTQRRLLEVKRYLIYSHMSMAEIAESTGFSDAAYLSRVFTKAFGMPPRRYRNDRPLRELEGS